MRTHSSPRFNPVKDVGANQTLSHTHIARKKQRDMANLFLKQAKQYAATRPAYPPELFKYIASKTARHDLVWDVGTGSGQAAASVS